MFRNRLLHPNQTKNLKKVEYKEKVGLSLVTCQDQDDQLEKVDHQVAMKSKYSY